MPSALAASLSNTRLLGLIYNNIRLSSPMGHSGLFLKTPKRLPTFGVFFILMKHEACFGFSIFLKAIAQLLTVSIDSFSMSSYFVKPILAFFTLKHYGYNSHSGFFSLPNHLLPHF